MKLLTLILLMLELYRCTQASYFLSLGPLNQFFKGFLKLRQCFLNIFHSIIIPNGGIQQIPHFILLHSQNFYFLLHFSIVRIMRLYVQEFFSQDSNCFSSFFISDFFIRHLFNPNKQCDIATKNWTIN